MTEAGGGHFLASRADRERVVDVLKAAFTQGRLTQDELEARVAQVLGSRTYGELAVVTAGIGTAVDKRMKSRRPGGQLPPRPGPRGGPPSGGTTGHDPVRPAARRDAIPGTGAIAVPALA